MREASTVRISDVNRKPKIWYTKKIPKPNRYLIFLSQISWYFLGIFLVFYRYFEKALVKIWLNIGIFGRIKIGLVFGLVSVVAISLVSVWFRFGNFSENGTSSENVPYTDEEVVDGESPMM